MKLIKEASELNTLIRSISKRGVKLDEDIHLAACSCLEHADLHGDVTLATHLVAAMPKSGRRKALVHWFTTNGKLTFKKDDVFGIDKGQSKSWKLEAAMKTPFWDLIPESEIKSLTIEALVNMVKSRISKAQENDALGEDFTIARFEAKLKGELAELVA